MYVEIRLLRSSPRFRHLSELLYASDGVPTVERSTIATWMRSAIDPKSRNSHAGPTYVALGFEKIWAVLIIKFQQIFEFRQPIFHVRGTLRQHTFYQLDFTVSSVYGVRVKK